MTEEQKIMLFNKPSEWTYHEWIISDARRYLSEIPPKNAIEWVCSSDMTDAEKKAHPEFRTINGYLKILDETESAQLWWDSLPEHKRQAIKDLPNFDATIFEECTGIKID